MVFKNFGKNVIFSIFHEKFHVSTVEKSSGRFLRLKFRFFSGLPPGRPFREFSQNSAGNW